MVGVDRDALREAGIGTAAQQRGVGPDGMVDAAMEAGVGPDGQPLGRDAAAGLHGGPSRDMGTSAARVGQSDRLAGADGAPTADRGTGEGAPGTLRDTGTYPEECADKLDEIAKAIAESVLPDGSVTSSFFSEAGSRSVAGRDLVFNVDGGGSTASAPRDSRTSNSSQVAEKLVARSIANAQDGGKKRGEAREGVEPDDDEDVGSSVAAEKLVARGLKRATESQADQGTGSSFAPKKLHREATTDESDDGGSSSGVAQKLVSRSLTHAASSMERRGDGGGVRYYTPSELALLRSAGSDTSADAANLVDQTLRRVAQGLSCDGEEHYFPDQYHDYRSESDHGLISPTSSTVAQEQVERALMRARDALECKSGSLPFEVQDNDALFALSGGGEGAPRSSSQLTTMSAPDYQCDTLIEEMSRAVASSVLPAGPVDSSFFSDARIRAREMEFPLQSSSAVGTGAGSGPRRLPSDVRDSVLHTLSNVQQQLDAIRHELRQYGVIRDPSRQQQ